MKQLISAETIRKAHADGKHSLNVILPNTIVTGEARSLAAQLGIALLEQLEKATGSQQAISDPGKPKVLRTASGNINAAEVEMIRKAIMAKLPAGSVSEELIDQLVQKTMREKTCDTADVKFQSTIGKTASSCAIKHVAAKSVEFSRFDGAGEGTQIGLADVIGSQDKSPMAVGYMSWSKSFFPWTLTYDEVDVVLEGKLHIRCDGQEIIASAGDTVFIPRGSAIEFGTTQSVRFVYVTYPADWQEQKAHR